jgi:hypothetical protein
MQNTREQPKPEMQTLWQGGAPAGDLQMRRIDQTADAACCWAWKVRDEPTNGGTNP